ncbi:PaaI family thioesterase [Qipengyuania atrilutea]|uniref:PaaI family thioesterase n=1 Tax=Qipengyuania atrilutea TaxID=2744473 RepID=A0A850H1V3_9SPHN|nr:PaaI family thioesterase [Actirhodobacter atriluteus]NVD43913.1 PaaI family thioesterase [Actirhodobacter atriluteus]
MSNVPSFIRYEAIDGEPGWYSWDVGDETLYNRAVLGELRVRKEGARCRLRMFPQRKHANVQKMVHGGATLGLIDIALFAGMHVAGDSDGSGAVTLELSTQFVGAGDPDKPLDAVTEVVRETGRLVFVRGEVVQEEHVVAAFSGILRKSSSPDR